MSVRGVRQLKELLIRYSDYDGSSRGIRDWMRLNLIQFATDNPDLKVVTEKKRCVHPFVRGTYLNTNSKTICIKNTEPEVIQRYIFDLRNQIGRKINSTGYKKPVVTKKPSIQGEWTERLNLIGLKFTVEHRF